jgi:acylphosphatase
VKNLEDGRIEATFEGEKEKVKRMVRKCKDGSRTSDVAHTNVIWENAGGDFTGFNILSQFQSCKVLVESARMSV